jgi:hypothetical protein
LLDPAGLDRLQPVVQPQASSGARPSSVRAPRTAAQYPCTTRASSSVLDLALDRPRTVFFNSFLACRSAS